MHVHKILSAVKSNPQRLCRCLHYVQGQEPEPRIREYFYFIDHQGQLFLDDSKMKNFTSCFKEKAFLEFFFKRLRLNETDRYPEFPYLSPCGRERNFIRCDDKAIVYTHIIETEKSDLLSYGGAAERLCVLFEPSKVCMLPETGRIYHPASPHIGGVGLIKSSVAIAISKYFEFENGEDNPPTRFRWKDMTYHLTNELLPLLTVTPVEARDLLETKS